MQDAKKRKGKWPRSEGTADENACTNVLLFCFSLINDTLHSHSRCRLSYRRPSMLTAMSWLFPTTCLYITIPSMGEGLADSTLQKVRLLIWRMVGTFFASYNLLRSFSPPHSFFQSPSHHSAVTHLVAPSSYKHLLLHRFHFFYTLICFFFCLLHTYYCALTENHTYQSLFIISITPDEKSRLKNVPPLPVS